SGVLQNGAGPGAGKSCRGALQRARLRKHGADEGGSRTERHLCSVGTGNSARAAHVWPRADALRTDGRSDRAVSENQGTGGKLLSNGKYSSALRLAPRTQ